MTKSELVRRLGACGALASRYAASVLSRSNIAMRAPAGTRERCSGRCLAQGHSLLQNRQAAARESEWRGVKAGRRL